MTFLEWTCEKCGEIVQAGTEEVLEFRKRTHRDVRHAPIDPDDFRLTDYDISFLKKARIACS